MELLPAIRNGAKSGGEEDDNAALNLFLSYRRQQMCP
jgi:hypothetical protein